MKIPTIPSLSACFSPQKQTTGGREKMAAKVETTTLANGTKMPMVGLGTWLTMDNHEEFKKGLRAALDAGYRRAH
ncbi:Aldo-ket-red domain-containing protein [Aphelenchoides fujianensis]|nr:Aldo-ket-red domain-containing protein [Aphelenchoides fujianensis]